MSRLPILFLARKKEKENKERWFYVKDSRRHRKEKTSKQSRRHGMTQWAIISKIILKLKMKFLAAEPVWVVLGIEITLIQGFHNISNFC